MQLAVAPEAMLSVSKGEMSLCAGRHQWQRHPRMKVGSVRAQVGDYTT
jgi:hypothetical protein